MTDFIPTPERQKQILSLLSQQGRLSVAEIVSQFSISEATARRDLESLASQGKAQRVHGGVIAVETAPPELPILEREKEAKLEEPRAKQIMEAIRPTLSYKRTAFTTWSFVHGRVLEAIGLVKHEEELRIKLAPDTPTLEAGKLHPWVWEAAQTFWDSRHYQQAVEAAWRSINARIQEKVGRRDISDTDLVNQTNNLSGMFPGRNLREPAAIISFYAELQGFTRF